MGVAKYPVNLDFFIDSEDCWYWMGLVAADGYVSDEKIELALNRRDAYILEYFQEKICPDKPLYIKGKTNSVKMTVHNKNVSKMVKDLFGMTTNKKYEELRLPDIPDDHVRHFVRGYIDGDGTIGQTKGYRGNKVYVGPRLRILGNRLFLEELVERIRQFVPNNTKSIKQKSKENVYEVTYNFRVADAIINWCYKDAMIFMKRKWEKYLNLNRGCYMKI